MLTILYCYCVFFTSQNTENSLLPAENKRTWKESRPACAGWIATLRNCCPNWRRSNLALQIIIVINFIKGLITLCLYAVFPHPSSSLTRGAATVALPARALAPFDEEDQEMSLPTPAASPQPPTKSSLPAVLGSSCLDRTGARWSAPLIPTGAGEKKAREQRRKTENEKQMETWAASWKKGDSPGDFLLFHITTNM